jgi:uncharacterized protein (TIGR02646 family)
MRYIKKSDPPVSFTVWKGKANESWQPSWGNLQNPEKDVLRKALLREQGGLCCYCGCELRENDCHIEHFRPQTDYSGLALVYENLHLSCLCDVKPGVPLHCGHAKADHFDENKTISPIEDDCEKYFSYSWTGEIVPSDKNDEKADYMRELLKLDIGLLRRQRAAALSSVFDVAFLGEATADDLQIIRQAFCRRNDSGNFPPFAHVVSRFAEQLME